MPRHATAFDRLRSRRRPAAPRPAAPVVLAEPVPAPPPEVARDVARRLAGSGRLAEALRVYRALVLTDPFDVISRGELGFLRVALGDWGGWRAIDYAQLPRLVPALVPGVPLWRGEASDGTLLIHTPIAGHGDMLQFGRFIARARERVGSVVALAGPNQARMMARFAGVDRVEAPREGLPDFAFQADAFGLAAAFATSEDAVRVDGPYLAADAATIGRWRPTIEAIPGFRVGVCWQGNPRLSEDARRSFRLASLEPLARVPGVSLVSLQKNHGAEQLAGAPFRVHDLGPDYAAGDWLDTAAVGGQLDLVVSPDTAIAHMAGAVGVPTWLALSRPCDSRWMLDRDDSPWYPTMRLFRQPEPGDWGAVFRRMAEALRGMAGSGG